MCEFWHTPLPFCFCILNITCHFTAGIKIILKEIRRNNLNNNQEALGKSAFIVWKYDSLSNVKSICFMLYSSCPWMSIYVLKQLLFETLREFCLRWIILQDLLKVTRGTWFQTFFIVLCNTRLKYDITFFKSATQNSL